MKNNFIYNYEFANIYEKPNDKSNVSTQILSGESFSILKNLKIFIKSKLVPIIMLDISKSLNFLINTKPHIKFTY